MTLSNGVEWLRRAQAEGFAIGAFNMNTLEQCQGIMAAGAEEAAPAIIQVSHRALLYLGDGNARDGLRVSSAIGRSAADACPTPIVLHLDHGTREEVLTAIDLGFTSVMFDGGDLSYEENVAQTRELTAIAHRAGVSCEAELGEVPRVDATGHSGPASLTDPDQAATFVAATGIDALAVSIGSIHAVQNKEVVLDLALLAAIRKAVDIPLVLHGSSGVTDEHIRLGIRVGLCKVNVATQLNIAFTDALRARLTAEQHVVDPRDYLSRARQATKARVAERMQFFGCSGKASAV